MKTLFLLLMAIFSFAEARELKIFLLTGQSNSLGAVKGDPASPELLKKYEPKATLYWHENFSSGGGVFPGASRSWGKVAPAMPRYNGNLTMGPEYGFAFALEKNGWFKDADVAIVKASRDGGDNANWMKDGQAYKILVQTVKNACAAMDKGKYSKITFAGLLYMQGESNKSDAVPETAPRLLELLKNLAVDLKSCGDVSALAGQRVIVGEHANWGTDNETDAETGNVTGALQGRDTEAKGTSSWKIMRELTASRPGMGYAPSRDLPKIVPGDGMKVHYNGKAQISLGARFAYEAARLEGRDAGAVRSGRYDVPLNAPEAWMNRKAPGRSVCVWNVASSTKPDVVNGVVKLFGIHVEDPAVGTVILASGFKAGDRLVLGPGGIRVDEGGNLLLKCSLQLAGRQVWSLAGGSSVTLTSNVPALLGGEPLPSELSGQAGVQIIRSGSEGTARVVIRDVRAAASLKCTWVLEDGVEMSLEGVNGQSVNFGKITVKKGAVLNLNGLKPAFGSVVKAGGTINP